MENNIFELKNGKIHGKYLRYSAEGVLLQEMTYQDGILHGPFKIFKYGLIQTEMFYANGKITGKMISYADNGNILQLSHYEADLLHGEFILYNEHNAEIIQKMHYVKGKKQGRAITYYLNSQGKIYEEALYEADLLEGFVKRYHLNGNISMLCEYKKGIATGAPVLFDENGMAEELKRPKKSSFWGGLFAKSS